MIVVIGVFVVGGVDGVVDGVGVGGVMVCDCFILLLILCEYFVISNDIVISVVICILIG